jgi:hypothetical protein
MPKIPWPPLVRAAKVPLLVKARDLLLTLIAWGVLMYFMRDLWILLYEFTVDFFLKIDTSNLVDWLKIWSRIAPFFYVAALLVLWIVVIGSLRRRAIRSTGLIHGKNSLRTVHQQFPLKQIDIALLAERFGVEKSQLEQWQKMRTVDVSVDDATGAKTIIEVNRAP